MKPLRAILLCFLAITVAGTVAAETTTSIDPVAELQDAAFNYEAAAQAQLALANSLLQARSKAETEEEAEPRRRRRISNASLELQAANHLMGAAGNLDHATRAWRAAAQATRETDSRTFFQRAGRETDQRAISLMRRAAELAEHAAIEFAANNDLQQQINASHRAGRIREQLAGRR